MSLSRRLVLALPLAALVGKQPAAAADPHNAATALIGRFYTDLLAVMKQAKQLSFDERYRRLAPAVSRTLDLGLMTRIAVGPSWTQLTAAQQQRLIQSFSRYTISVYASRFDEYGGERFEVEPNPASSPNGSVVRSRIIKANGEPVTINYLMHQDGSGAWKVMDVYLSGTISELATRRSEFVSVLSRDGAEGLVQMLDKRTAALRAG